MSLNEELSAIETIVDECEKEIQSGRLDVDVLVRQVQSVSDPNAMILKGNELIENLLSRSNKINVLHMKELKYQYPNNTRIEALGCGAAQCYLTLMDRGLSVSEELVSPDLKSEVQAQNQ